jgi:hypothetical protein
MTTIEVFQKAAELGLKLGVKSREKLTVQPVERCPAEFFQVLKAHKWHLLVLLQLPFTMVYSQTLGETIFLCEDDDTKAALKDAGAESFSIYTRDELRILVDHNRAKPFVPDELLRLHQAKRTFNGKTAKSPFPTDTHS